MLSVYSALFSLALLVPCSFQAKFMKCCPYNQQLNINFEKCEPLNTLDYDIIDFEDQYPWWLPMNATALSSVNNQPIPGFFVGEYFKNQVQAGGSTLCGASSTRHFLKVDQFKYLDNGSLLGDFGGAVGVKLLQPQSFCADRVAINYMDVRLVALCPCSLFPCQRKCCPFKMSLSPSLDECVNDDQQGKTSWNFSDRVNSELVTVRGNSFCSFGMYQLDPAIAQNALVQADGSLLTNGTPKISVGQFCLDEKHILVCGLPPTRIFGVLFILGALILVATLLAQLLQPQKGGHTRYLMAHVSSLLITYVVMAIEHLSPYPPPAACYFIAFTIQFSFLAAIFWLNVMCFDIAWSFSGFRVPKGSMKCQNKRFILYSLYAWGSSGIITITTIIIEFSPTGDMVIKPGLAVVSCWFQGDLATFGYFYGPVSCLLLVNLILFVYTVVRIFELRRSTAVLRQTDSALHRGKTKEEDQVKESFMLVLKLFCLMGVTWLIEIISWVIKDPSYYWYIADIVNINRSLFIFILFCCKRNVWNHMQLQMHYAMPWCIPKPTVDQEKERSSSSHTDSSRFSRKSSGKSSAKSSTKDPKRKKSLDSNTKETNT